jgi:hypothetical protein
LPQVFRLNNREDGEKILFGNLFQFRKISDSEKYLFKEFGKSDKVLKPIIERIPSLSLRIYETARTATHENVRNVVDDYDRKILGNNGIFMNLNSGQLSEVEMEIINLILYYISKEFQSALPNPDRVDAFIHAINLELTKFYLLPEEKFLKYLQMSEVGQSDENVNNAFNLSLSSLILNKPDVTLANSFKTLCPLIQKASVLMTEMMMQKQF